MYEFPGMGPQMVTIRYLLCNPGRFSYCEESGFEEKALLDYLKKFNNILDLGCGAGNAVYEMRNLGVNAEGVDMNPEDKPYLVKARFDGLSSALPNQKYDLAISVFAFDYYYEFFTGTIGEQFYKQAQELAKVLKPGARLLIIMESDPSIVQYYPDSPELLSHRVKVKPIEFLTSSTEFPLFHTLRSAGFKAISLDEIGQTAKQGGVYLLEYVGTDL